MLNAFLETIGALGLLASAVVHYSLAANGRDDGHVFAKAASRHSMRDPHAREARTSPARVGDVLLLRIAAARVESILQTERPSCPMSGRSREAAGC